MCVVSITFGLDWMRRDRSLLCLAKSDLPLHSFGRVFIVHMQWPPPSFEHLHCIQTPHCAPMPFYQSSPPGNLRDFISVFWVILLPLGGINSDVCAPWCYQGIMICHLLVSIKCFDCSFFSLLCNILKSYIILLHKGGNWFNWRRRFWLQCFIPAKWHLLLYKI